MRKDVAVTPATTQGIGNASTGLGRAAEAGTEAVAPRRVVRRSAPAARKAARAVDDVDARHGTLQADGEAFVGVSTRHAVLVPDAGRTVTAPTNGAGHGLARTARTNGTGRVTHVDRNSVVSCVAVTAPQGFTSSGHSPAVYHGPYAAALPVEGTCRDVIRYAASPTDSCQSFTCATATVSGRPRRCTLGTGPSTCPFMAVVAVGQQTTTPTGAATSAVYS